MSNPALALLREAFEVRGRLSPVVAFALSLAFVLMVLGVWWYVTRGEAEEAIVSPVVLPSPQAVWDSFPALWTRRELPKNVAISLIRVLKGFGVALVVVVPLGLLMGSYAPIRAFFEPVNVLAGYLPLITIVPLSFVWFGPLGDEFQKVAFLALACFFFMLPLVISAVEEVDDVYLNTGQTLGAGGWRLLLRVILPISLPGIYNAARLAFGVGWTWIIVAESLSAENGLGAIFMKAYRFEKEHMYWTALVILMIGFVADRMLAMLSRQLFPYRFR